MIQFSCADFTFPVLSHQKSLELISLMDFKWVDIGLFQDRSHIQPSDQFDKPEQKGKEIYSLAQSYGLGISDIFFQAGLDFKEVAINHPDAKVRNEQREIFKRAIEYTKAAGCKNFSGLPGVDFGTNDSKSICIDELGWRTQYAKQFGVTYSIEPHLGSIMSTPEDALYILEKTPGLTIVLDHSHYTHQGIDIERVHPMTKYASHIHARGAAKGEMQTSVESNTTDFEAVSQHIKEVDYDGFICIEYTYVDWENCNRTDNVSETMILRSKLAQLLGI